jgi:2,3-bisphosphoglycerate-dependent phosphoglycerate mutase
MARRINLLLVRHALSEANLDKRVNMRLPDQRVPLAQIGHEQARKAGEFLAGFLSQPEQQHGRTRILCSPYLRTRQTSAAIETQLNRADISYDKREEIALREISFGLFDGYADDELKEHFPLEHSWYQKHLDVEKANGADGEFWAAMPLGESRAQVADRVKGVFGTILRDADRNRPDPVQNFIIVSHGVTIRAFLMQWLHHEFEWYGRQRNPGNCSVNLISSDGTRPYEHRLAFKGFEHRRETAQDKRENGKVDAAA